MTGFWNFLRSEHPRQERRVGARKGRRQKPARRKAAPAVEPLEDRCVPSVTVPADLSPRAADPPALTIDNSAYDPTRILVRFRDPRPEAQPVAMGTLGRAFSLTPGLREVLLPQGTHVEDALAAYRANPSVLYAEPNYVVHASVLPDDPQFGELWGLNNTGQSGGTPDADIDAPEAWDTFSPPTGEPIVVAVIDTGIDYTHPELANRMWTNPDEIPGNGIDDDGNGFVDDVHGADFVNNDGDPMDDHFHGTHVSGTIAAAWDNAVGVAGVVGPANIQLMALKFLDFQGSGYTADAISAVNYAATHGARVSNNSWGGGGYSQGLYDAIASAGADGHLFVAAAGNDASNNDSFPSYPASYNLDNILSVAATDRNDQLASFSNYGLTTVDLGAPGVDILSTVPGNSYATHSGTSMATPHVTGAAALVWAQNPTWSYGQIKTHLLESVDAIPALDGKSVTGGRLNVGNALVPGTLHIISSTPSGGVSNPVSSVQVIFNRPIDPLSFTTAEDIASFTGPGGVDLKGQITDLSGSGTTYTITFNTQSALGDYSMVIGPDIFDLDGNPMDQDADGNPGEPTQDQYTAAFTLTGPRIISSTPSGNVNGEVSSVQVIFDRPIDPLSFTTAEDIASFTGPDGVDLKDQITDLSGSGTTYTITFNTQSALGDYSMVIGPDIFDLDGNPMDQDADGNPGEPTQDQYTAAFTLFDKITFVSGDVPAPIQDYTITISELPIDQDITIADLEVSVDITHTWIGDVEVYLVQPGGDPFSNPADLHALVLQRGGSSQNMDVTFDDQAAQPIGSVVPMIGTFRPEEPLSAFNGLSTLGTWELWIYDAYFFDVGTLNAWSLTVTPAQPPSNDPPTADAGGDYSGDEGSDITLSGANSTDPDGNIVLYEWDLDNDGQYDDATGVTTTFNRTDSSLSPYTVGLRVTDSGGLSDTDSATVTVNNVAPTADAGGTYRITIGQTATLDASGSTDPGNDIDTYAWDLDNNGSYETTGVTATFGPADIGTYKVPLLVTDADGATGTDTATVIVSEPNQPPVADAGGPYDVNEGSTVTLSGANSSDPDGTIVLYEWDLDNDGQYDDATGITANFSRTDSSLSPYTVGLRVTDDDGDIGTDTATVNVHNVAPTADAGGPYEINLGDTAHLNASGSSDPGNDIATYAWDLNNDGSIDGYGVTWNYTPSAVGTYGVRLRVTDADGAYDEDLTQIVVTQTNRPPTANAGGYYSGNEGSDITLDGSGSTDPDGNSDIVLYEWDLDNDGQYDDATGVTTTFNRTEDGYYSVGLRVTDRGGLSDIDTTYVTVYNVAPTAEAGGPYYITLGETVTLDGSGSTDPGNDITTYYWDRDDDGIYDIVGVQVDYTPTTVGTHTVHLLVFDNDNASGTDTAQVIVNEPPPSGPALLTGVVTTDPLAPGGWNTVTLDHTYQSMVVVATADYQAGQGPAVVRIRNAEDDHFDVQVVTPGGGPLSGIDVSYMVVEEGVYTQAEDGVTMEAVKFDSTITDYKGSYKGEQRSYANSYTSPVVFGQVMTANDPEWSVFWSRGNSKGAPPDASSLYVGKHVGEDPNTTRGTETVGYVVFEAGNGMIGDTPYQVGVGPDIVQGATQGAPYTYNHSLLTATTALVTQTAMDGGDGSWAVLYGDNPVGPGTLNVAVDEDQLRDSERNHTNEQLAYIVFGEAPQTPTSPELRTGVGMSTTGWATITLNHTYNDMVAVVTANYDSGSGPLVTRVRNAQGSSFQFEVVTPGGAPVSGVQVYYVVVEAGVYNVADHGIEMEAHTLNSTVTDHKGSWVGQGVGYSNSYTTPVVLGQVMTANDPDWSVFWSRGSSKGAPPDASALYVGKHVGEDPDTIRADETVGYIVIEAGSGTVSGLSYDAGVGGDTIMGVGNSPPYSYSHSVSSPYGAIASQVGMDGGDGGWAILYGSSAIYPGNLNLAIDEDQVGDLERNHTSEQVAFIVFGTGGSVPAPPPPAPASFGATSDGATAPVSPDRQGDTASPAAPGGADTGGKAGAAVTDSQGGGILFVSPAADTGGGSQAGAPGTDPAGEGGSNVALDLMFGGTSAPLLAGPASPDGVTGPDLASTFGGGPLANLLRGLGLTPDEGPPMFPPQQPPADAGTPSDQASVGSTAAAAVANAGAHPPTPVVEDAPAGVLDLIFSGWLEELDGPLA